MHFNSLGENSFHFTIINIAKFFAFNGTAFEAKILAGVFNLGMVPVTIY